MRQIEKRYLPERSCGMCATYSARMLIPGPNTVRNSLSSACSVAALKSGARTTFSTMSSNEGCTTDRKSTRLNSSHSQISYAVFCLKKKKKIYYRNILNTNKKRIPSHLVLVL